MKRTYLLSLCMLMLTVASAQTQQGVVKTKGRMVSGQLLPGTKLGGAVISVRGRSAVLSQSNGNFSFPVSGQSFMLDSVRKKGYQLVDAEAAPRSYAVTKNPLYVLMETPEQQLQDKLTAERKIRRTLQQQLQKREDEIEALKAQQKLSDAEYRKQLQQLYSQQESNENIISLMAERYAKLDFDEMDDFNRRISQLILDGHLTKADSLLNTKGDINERADALRQHQEANALAEQEIVRKQKKLEQSKALAHRELEDLAQDCYSKYEIFKIQYQNDSAAYYVKLRAELDTTNVSWQKECADFIKVRVADYELALNYYEIALRQTKNIGEGRILKTVEILNEISDLYGRWEKYENEIECAQKALEIGLPDLGEQHDEVADSYNCLGEAYRSLAKYEEALPFLQKALEIWERDSNNIELSDVYNNIGALYHDKGEYNTSLTYMQKSLEIRLRLANKDNMKIAQSYSNIGQLYSVMGDYDKALEYNNHALRIRLETLGPNHPDVANSYNNLGSVYYGLNNIEKSIECFTFVLDNSAKIYGEYNMGVASCHHNLGVIYSTKGDYQHSLEHYLSSLEIFSSLLGEEHPNIAIIYTNIGALYQQMKEYDNSRDYHLKALDILRKTLGERTPYIANVYSNLGELYLEQGDYPESERFLKEALNLRIDLLGEQHPDVISTKSSLLRIQYEQSLANGNVMEFFSTHCFVITVANHEETEELPSVMEYILLEYADWNQNSTTSLYKAIGNNPKDVLVMKGDIIKPLQLEKRLHEIGIRTIDLKERKRIDSIYKKWKATTRH